MNLDESGGEEAGSRCVLTGCEFFVSANRRETRLKSFIQEAEQVSGFGDEFVVRTRPVAAIFGVPVKWLLAAMSWETGQYKAYRPVDGNSGPHWLTNTRDAAAV